MHLGLKTGAAMQTTLYSSESV